MRCNFVQVGLGAACIAVGADIGYALALIVLAILLISTVWVRGFSHLLVGLQVVVGVEVPATAAALIVVAFGTVNELLW